MGYRSSYSIEIRLPDSNHQLIDRFFKEAIVKALRSESQDAAYCLLESGSQNERGSWPEHQKELKAFSTKYPAFLFVLHGVGESSGDIWKKYFLNGKMQVSVAVLQIEPFDRSLLK